MKSKFALTLCATVLALLVVYGVNATGSSASSARTPTESDRKVIAGRLLLKWGGYIEKVKGENRKAWAAKLWPSLAGADLHNLEEASRAVTYEGMRNALLGQRPSDDEIIDMLAKQPAASGEMLSKQLGSANRDLVFTPIKPCRIADSRIAGGRIPANSVRDLKASNPGGSFANQGGSSGDCRIPANPAALSLSITTLDNLTPGIVRIFPFDSDGSNGSTHSMNTVNTNVTNDVIVAACQACTQELKLLSGATTHYVITVTGYFAAPISAPLVCTDVFSERLFVSPGQLVRSVLNCELGLTATSCDLNVFGTVVEEKKAIFNSALIGRETCGMEIINIGSKIVSAKTQMRCCRTPGQ